MYQLSIHSSTWWRRIGSQECLFILWHHRNVMVANYLTTESIQDSFHPTLTHIEWREFLATFLSLAGCFPLPYIMTCLINVSYLCLCMWLLSLQMNKTLRLYKGKWSWYQCTTNSLSKWADKCSKVRKNAPGLGIYAKPTCYECFLNMLWVSPFVSRLLSSSLKNILFVRKECVAVWEDLLAWLVTEVSVDVKNLCFIIPSDERRWVTCDGDQMLQSLLLYIMCTHTCRYLHHPEM